MFSKKKELDAHIQDVFKKIKSEKERNLKCLAFARQYAQLKEWGSARRYATAFLSERPNSAQALRLQGECDENLNHKERALNEYRTSLAIDGTQRDLVFKVCELLCAVPADADAYQYWSERAEQLDNGHPVVFKLREHMLTIAPEKSDDNVVCKELEDLILAEQKARPNDPRPKCRLLKLYIEKGQVIEAYQLASQTEIQTPFLHDLSWYETICNVFDAYEKVMKVDWEFHAQKLLVLDRMAALCLMEIKPTPAQVACAPGTPGTPSTPAKAFNGSSPTSACVEAIFLLDQALFEASKASLPAQSAKRQLAQALLSHVAAQLAFYMATLLFKKAKRDGSQWANALKCAGPLLLLACQTSPPDEDVAWLKDLTETARTAAKVWMSEGEQRRSQAGHVLLVLNQKKKFLDNVAPFMVTKWQDRLFETFFSSRSHQLKRITSYFATLCDTNNLAITLPTPEDLWPCDEDTQLRQRSDINYLVWYGLLFLPRGLPWAPINQSNDDPSLAAATMVPKRSLCPPFVDLKLFTREIPGLVPATPETLCQLDIDAFLYATVVCAASVLEEHKRRWSDDRPATLPAIISESLCSPMQIQWWTSVCWLLLPSSASKCVAPEVRRTLKAGLETVRSVEAQSGLQDVRLMCALARYFSGRALLAEQARESLEVVGALYARASHYWSCAKPALERIKTDRTSRQLPSERMFCLPGKEIEKSAAESLLCEASFSEACQLVRASRLEEAIEAFSELPSPYASMQQALLYKKLGEKEKSDETLKKALLTRARDSLYVTLDRLRAPRVDPQHPLNSELRDYIEEVEDHINTLFPESNKARGRRLGIVSDTSSEEEDFTAFAARTSQTAAAAFSTPVSVGRYQTPRDVRNYNGTPINGNRSQLHSSFHGTPRDVLDSSRPREEARPSPERLDAQMRQMMIQRETELQTMARLVEAARSDDRGMKDEMKQLYKKVQETQSEVQEIRRENQELQKNVKDIQNDVQKIVKALMATQLQAASPGVSEAHNIPDEDLYLYGEDELENEYTAADLAAATAAHLGAPYPQQATQHHRAATQPTHATAPAFPALPPGFQFRAPGFFPLARAVDPALMYQSALSYYSQGALPFSEGQRLPEFQLGPPMLPPQAPVMNPGMPPPQPANVFSRLGQVLGQGLVLDPAELGGGVLQAEDLRVPHAQRPMMPPPMNMPPHPNLANLTPSLGMNFEDAGAFGLDSGMHAPHAFQISMPPQAQIPTESPLDKTPNLGDSLVVSPKSFLQSVPSPEYSSIKPGTSKQKSDTPRRAQRLSTGSGVGSEDGEEVAEHDPCPNFQPLIPLPDEVAPNTGEEGETVLFENRAKLFRFVDGEWKERGVGLLKILENPSTGKARILMRRDQVLKVCCNHMVPVDLSLSHIAGNDRTWSWAAPDFADEKVQVEKLGVRFKTSEEANLFKEVIEKVKEAAAKAESSAAKVTSPVTPAVVVPTPGVVVPVTSAVTQPATSTVTLGGFTFTSPPTVLQKSIPDAPDSAKPQEEASKPSPFSNFSFGKPATFASSSTFATPPAFGKTSTVFGENATKSETVIKTPSINTTKVFESSPLSQLSFASIAKQSAPSTQSQSFSFKQGFDGAGAKVFSTPTSTTTVTSTTSPASPEESSTAEEFEPNVEFKPVVPLPELVDVKTGEEGEEVLFEQRAKLLRFESSTKEWKERGIGKMKITVNPVTGRVRLIMRREQVLKVCCNHFLVQDMVLQSLNSSDRSWIWYAQDYSEGILESELFAIKFKNPDEALTFKDKWTEIQSDMVDDKLIRGNQTQEAKSVPAVPKPLSEMFKPQSGSWECSQCYTRNLVDNAVCVACQGPKPGQAVAAPNKSASKSSLSEMFKPTTGSWECSQCYTRNLVDNAVCVACQGPKPGQAVAAPNKSASKSSLSEMFKPATGSWECSECYVRNNSEQAVCMSCNHTNPKSSAPPLVTGTETLFSKFKPTAGSWECPDCYSRNTESSNSCAACTASKPGSCVTESPKLTESSKPSTTLAPGLSLNFATKGQTTFSFGMPVDAAGAAASPTVSTVDTSKPPMQPATFSFGSTTAPSIGADVPKSFMFGGPEQAPAVQAPTTTSFMFGSAQQPATSTPSTSFTFGTTSAPTMFGGSKPLDDAPTTMNFGITPGMEGTLAAPSLFGSSALGDTLKKGSAFTFGSPHKFDFNFTGVKAPLPGEGSPPKTGLAPRSPRTSTSSAHSPGTPGGATAEDSDDEVENDEGDHIHFAPVIPLPEVVQVVTGEENEDVLYCHRAKLYRFVEGEWKERGVGDFKILQHKENKIIRFLMRRDQVLKICLNHRFTGDINIEPKDKDDKTFVWYASDFSEQEIKTEKFALRFKTPEIAAAFKEAADSAKALVLAAERGEEASVPPTPATPRGDGSMAVQAGTPFTVSRLAAADQTVDISADDTVSSTTSSQFESPAMRNFSFAQATPSPQPAAFSLGKLLGTSQPNPQDAVRRNIFGGQSPAWSESSVKTAQIASSEPDNGDVVELVSEQLASSEEVERARSLQLPDNFYLYRLRPRCPGCRGCEEHEEGESPPQQQKPVGQAFAGPAKFSSALPANTAASAPVVNGQSEEKSAIGVAFLPTENKLSFANLAQQQSPFGFGNMQSSKPPATIFSWAGVGAPVFGGSAGSTPSSATKTDKGAESSGEEDGGQDDTHDPHFEPIVALPDAIEVRTGEEDEEKLFSQRAKLFRFDPTTKEWKERGVGEMKLLHHVANGSYRLLLRREQVHKVVLNQLLTTAVELTRMSTNNNAWCWAGMNFAEDEPKLEELAVRFKNEDILQEFYAKVEESKAALVAHQSSQAAASVSPPEVAAPVVAPSADVSQAESQEAEEEEEEAGEEDYETYDDDDDDEEEDDDEDSVMFEKRVTLLTRGANDPEGQWRGLGQGTLRVIHDVELCGMRVLVEVDSTGELVCSLPVHPGASMQQHDKECHFSGHDEVTDSTTIKHFNARFSSKQAAEEFKLNFLEGLEMAEQAAAYEEEDNEQ